MAMLMFCATAHASQPEPVRYEDFGARGDGKTDDLEAIVKAHEHANRMKLPVRADDEATYYLGGRELTAVIQTDTDFGRARFIIDDRDVEDRTAWMFEVRSTLPRQRFNEITSLKAGQPRLDVPLEQSAVVIVTDTNTKRYIRRGLNQNDGKAQTDVFLVERDGTIHKDTPVLWDFDQVTEAFAYPVDAERLTVRGGRFTTIANADEPRYTYYARGIHVRRSNVLVEGLEHRIEGEGEQGAPYRGFILVSDSAGVTIRDTGLSGRKTYRTIGAAGKPVSMGSYGLSMGRSVNVSVVNCRQLNDIHDRSRWGIMASNYSKNLRYDRCSFSRFDAHMGVANATIRDSTLGHVGINLIGSGTFLLENTTVHSRSLINLRPDYGSTWQGEIIIRNCRLEPPGDPSAVYLIQGRNDGAHDFGYTCYMPERVVIDGLHIEDGEGRAAEAGPFVFGNFNPRYTTPDYVERFPYIKPREVLFRGVTTQSGNPLRVSPNAVMFSGVRLTEQGAAGE